MILLLENQGGEMHLGAGHCLPVDNADDEDKRMAFRPQASAIAVDMPNDRIREEAGPPAPPNTDTRRGGEAYDLHGPGRTISKSTIP